MAGHRDLNLPSTSAVGGPHGDGRPRSIERYAWPTNGKQPDYIGFLNPDALVLGRGTTSGSSATTHIPGDASTNLREVKRSGPPTNASQGVGTGLTRTQKAPTRQSKPYGASHARITEHQNARAGPSTLPTLQPTGGSKPETSVDAEKYQTTTEGDNVPRKKIRARQEQGHEALREICDLVIKWKECKVSQNEAMYEVFRYIQRVRRPVYDRPRFAEVKSKSGPLSQSENAQKQRQQKAEQRYYLEMLSQYYRLEGVEGNEDEAVWTWTGLLETLLKDLKARPPS